ncbi:MAG: hypothetical protein JNM56_39160 [Planctomycetia bacterium]|nr:hypothetical protein [Planctomycetia bacterium]
MNNCTLSQREVRIATIELQLRDLAALRAACWLLRWELRAGQRTYRAFGRPGQPCAHAIGVPGCAFEIGLIDQGGHWLPAWDAGPAPDLDAALGPRGLNLWRSYLRETIRRASQPRGHTFNQHTDIGGVLRVRIGGSLSQHSAHVRMAADGATSLWTFGPGAWEAFRYLGEALGRLDDACLSDGEPDDPVSR